MTHRVCLNSARSELCTGIIFCQIVWHISTTNVSSPCLSGMPWPMLSWTIEVEFIEGKPVTIFCNTQTDRKHTDKVDQRGVDPLGTPPKNNPSQHSSCDRLVVK